MERAPSRGDVWHVDPDPVRGHEQGRPRPAVIVSADEFNIGPSALVIVCLMTTRDRQIRSHVRIDPPEGGLRRASFVQCEQVRTISTERLISRFGALGPTSMAAIDDRLRILLDL